MLRIPVLPREAQARHKAALELALSAQIELREMLVKVETAWAAHWAACPFGESCSVHQELVYQCAALRSQIAECDEVVADATSDDLNN